jgi:hypothetical protein
MDEGRAVVHIVVSDDDALVQPVKEYYRKVGGVNECISSSFSP